MSTKKNSVRKQVKKTYYLGKFPFLAERLLIKVAYSSLLSTDEYGRLLSKNEKNRHGHGRLTYLLEQLQDIDYVTEYGIVIGSKHQCKSKSGQYFFPLKEKGEILRLIGVNSKVEQRWKKHIFDSTKVPHRLICKHCKRSVAVKLRGNSKILQNRCWKLSFNGTLVVISLLDEKERWDFIKNSDNDILRLAKLLIQSQKKHFVDLLTNRLSKNVKEEPNLIPIAESWYKEMNTKILNFIIDKSVQKELEQYKKDLELEQQTEIMLGARNRKFVSKFG